MCDSMMEQLTRIIADAINEALEDCRGTVARFARDLDAAKADADSARSSSAADRRALEDREAEVIALRGRYERAMRERDEAREAGAEQDVMAQHARAEALGELLRQERRQNIELRRELEQLRECVEPVDDDAPHDNLIDALQRGRQAAAPVVDQFQFRGVRVDDERIQAAEVEIAELRESEAALRSYSVALMEAWTEQRAEMRRTSDALQAVHRGAFVRSEYTAALDRAQDGFTKVWNLLLNETDHPAVDAWVLARNHGAAIERFLSAQRPTDRTNDEGKRIDSARTMGPAGTPDEVDASADRGDAGGVGPVPG